MLSIHHISKSFGIEKILDDITFNINAGECWGLIGPNGCGKSTLLRILAAEEKADQGSFAFSPLSLRVGYLSQSLKFEAGDTLQNFLTRMQGDLPRLEACLEEVAAALAAAPSDRHLQETYDRTLADLSRASRNAGKSQAALAALGLDELPFDLPLSALSGGQKTRLALAGILISNPQLLLLDEPTNHLDLDMLAWLENWLSEFTGGVLIVSHDRAFLDQVASGILEMDPTSHHLKAYPGNYSAYLDQKASEIDHQWQEYADQQTEITRLKQSAAHMRGIAKFRKGGKADSGDKFAKGFFANRGLETVRRAKSIEARIEKLLTEDRVDKPARTWQMKIDFESAPSSGRHVLAIEEARIGYPGNTLLEGLNLHIRFGERVALVGPNGSGKTTLMRVITGKLEPLSGTVRLGSNVRLGYMAQEQEELDREKNALEILDETTHWNQTEIRSFLSKYLLKGDDVYIPAGRLSFGERSRLSLACLVAQGNNFLLLDEPLNHLDIPSRARFEEALSSFEGTILTVAHDRYFIEGYATKIWEMVPPGIRETDLR
ncbi:protein containg ATPase component of ABC transporter with duplicated ATPase domains [Longilinea arvoryzae]|uniref:Protein containg ATPase component of ABC transporter with duplicated ATPase domains n=1 Tax=Longilinea arvoryzae TaxID=360412 RepID=A0A0S7BM61_9CHLR|nr:ABC-F family ATP-binding cassette domain-containing protein [Longilinea arvoryzae]GAP14794.1 protein containg ATPase component of ABC transporter with duplicated ATPase domains [Longilinea arvoryzae]